MQRERLAQFPVGDHSHCALHSAHPIGPYPCSLTPLPIREQLQELAAEVTSYMSHYMLGSGSVTSSTANGNAERHQLDFRLVLDAAGYVSRMLSVFGLEGFALSEVSESCQETVACYYYFFFSFL